MHNLKQCASVFFGTVFVRFSVGIVLENINLLC